MKKTTLIAALAILAIVLSIALVYAQGRGAGFARTGQACPRGNLQSNPNAGGWWTRIQPTTPEQKAFVDKVTDFHNQVREKQMALAQLRASNGDPKKIATMENEITALRTQFQEFMTKNQQVCQQPGVAGCGVCCANCPMQGECPGACGCPLGMQCNQQACQQLGVAGCGVCYANCPMQGECPGACGCPLGMQCNMNGGWWTQVQPKTAEQKAFVDKVTDLHNQIRDRQTAMKLRASNGDPKRIAALEQETLALQTQLRDYMMQNQQIRQQLGPIGPGMGCGMQGQCMMRNGQGGPGMDRGMGRGMGMWRGMNPNCPCK